jgi:hypothetical protein
MEQFFFLVLRNLPLKRLVADALGKIELMGCSKGSWKRLCILRGTSAHVRSESDLTNQPRILC